MIRPSFEDIYMTFALALANRSTCRRLKVGCAVVSLDFTRVLGIGYNGNVPGGPNDCDVHGPEAVGACGCLHAEENAFIKCDAPKETQKIVFCTHLPCIMCAKRMLVLGGVKRVLYAEDYRRRESLELLREHGVEIAQYLPRAVPSPGG